MAETSFDSGAYCVTDGGIEAVSGNEILTCIFNADGTKLLAIEGEQESTLSMEAETSEVSTKDSKGGWQNAKPSTRSWELELETAQIRDAESNKLLRKAFEAGEPVCMKQVYDDDNYTPLCGGLAYVTSYEQGAPSDDVATASITLTGSGKLTWFDIDTGAASSATAKPSNRADADSNQQSSSPSQSDSGQGTD